MPRRGENIYKRKDGRWEGRYIKGYDENNKAQYASVYAHTYGDVKTKLFQAKSNILKNEKKINEYEQTFMIYAMKWLDNIHLHAKHSTYVKYSNIVNNHLIPELGNHKICELTTEDIRKYADKKLYSGNVKTSLGLSPKTVKDILSVLRLILRYAGEFGTDIHCNIDLINIRSTSVIKKTITEKEHHILLKYLLNKPDYIKIGILICLYTGIRIGEICAIRFEDISLTNNTIYVTKTMQRLQTLNELTKSKTEITISPPKSISSQREIPLPIFIAELIKGLSYNPQAYILTGESNRYIEPRTMENKFKSCLKKCGLPQYNFHQLRHRFATHCIEVGFEIKTLSEILGHSSVNITLDRYVHSSLELKRQNMNKLQKDII